MNKKVKHFVTKVKPPTRFEVSGPCMFEVRPINKYGEIEIMFEIANNVIIEKYKLIKRKHDEAAL